MLRISWTWIKSCRQITDWICGMARFAKEVSQAMSNAGPTPITTGGGVALVQGSVVLWVWIWTSSPDFRDDGGSEEKKFIYDLSTFMIHSCKARISHTDFQPWYFHLQWFETTNCLKVWIFFSFLNDILLFTNMWPSGNFAVRKNFRELRGRMFWVVPKYSTDYFVWSLH